MSRAATFDYKGQVVLITGGGTGIGRGMAEAFLAAGAEVMVTGRRRAPLAALCDASGGKASFVQMDVTEEGDRERTLATLLDRHGRLDLLVNNAIAHYRAPLQEQQLGQIEQVYATLLTAPTALIRLALPHLAASKGCVINISSVGAKFIPYPSIGLAAYAAAKAGVSQLTRALASEVGPLGVRINAIAPGLTLTEATSDGAIARAPAQTPLGRMGLPADIAGVALFLGSDAASWVTGQVIDASGGWGLTG